MITLTSNQMIALGRMLFIPRGNLRKEQLKIEASGPYRLLEKDEYFIIQNMDCCKAIMVTVRAETD
ncbi:hypothetical protein [Desulfofundulus sp.]|uniref:hypothetical protein n=1 Tax=Desulfofundulus sp. TaxID=2282750 RepID=UPI003C7942A0